MQFLAGTWASYGIDADQDGTRRPLEPGRRDRLRRQLPAASGAPDDLEAALYAYNHSHAYVAEVLAWAEHYQEAADAQTGQPLDLSSLPDRGDRAALAAAVLSNPNIELRPEAEADVRAGRVDPRVLAVLLALADRFSLAGVGPFVSGHSYYVAGTNRPSNHAFGRAVDIGTINRRARLTGERRRPPGRARPRLAARAAAPGRDRLPLRRAQRLARALQRRRPPGPHPPRLRP